MEGVKGCLSLVLVLFITLILSASAIAGEDYHIIAGAELDTRNQSFSYMGAGLSRSIDKRVFVTGQLFTGYLKYSFDSEGKTLTARTPIVTPSAGLRYDGYGYSVGGSVGADFRKPEKELASGGTDTETETGVSVQGEAYLRGDGKKSLGLIVSYSTIDDFFWGRARGKKGVYTTGDGGELHAGVELIAMGNSDFSATQAGVFLEALRSVSKLSILLKAGVKNSSAFNTGGYGGIELFKGF